MSAHDEAGALRAITYALFANLGIAIAKGAAAFLTGSGAMLAESIHSLADCTNQGFLFVGLRRAKLPPTEEHPLGYGKALFFWSFLVALLLFSMGGLFSVFEGVRKLSAHGEHGLDRPWIAIGVLSLGVLLEGGSLLGALRESREDRHGRSLWRWMRTSRRSELVVVAGEDLAALLGLLLALAAVVTTMITGNPVFDALGTLSIGVLLLVIAFVVGLEVKSLLIGESADPRDRAAIRSFLVEHDTVEEVLSLLTLQLGPDIMVAVKARMAEKDSARALIEDINRCERELKERFPRVRWSFFEPDVRD